MRALIRSALAAGLLVAMSAPGSPQAEMKIEAPELVERPEEEWINSAPLKLSELRGHVVVLHFWTFG